MEAMTVAVEPRADSAVVRVSGELDIFTAPRLRRALQTEIEDGRPRVVVDLSCVSFCDSSGFGVFVDAVKRVRRYEGWLRLAGMQPRVMKVFAIAGLDQLFPSYATVAEALADPAGMSPDTLTWEL